MLVGFTSMFASFGLKQAILKVRQLLKTYYYNVLHYLCEKRRD